jgi:hypothetical protein
MLDDEIKDTLIRAFAGHNAEDSELIQHCEQLAEELEKAWAV